MPQFAGERHQLLHQRPHVLWEAALGAVVAHGDGPENEVDGAVGRQRAVEYGEVALEPRWNVVSAASCWTKQL